MSKQKKKNHKKMMNKKTGTIILAAVLVLALAAGFVIPAITSRNKGEVPKEESGSLVDGAVDVLDGGDASTDTDATSTDTESGESGEDAPDAVPEDDDPQASDAEESGDVDADKLNGYTEGLPEPGKTPSGYTPKSEKSEEPPIPTISFPYAVSGTDLVVQQVSPYSGYYIEDASDQEVSNVAAIVLTNNGGDLDFAGIGISQGDRSLAFSASQIPAGATVIIQEQTKAAYAEDYYYSCTATVTESSGFDLKTGTLMIEKHNDGTFDVANVSEETIPEIKVYFKNYLPDEDVYVGGITYSVTLTDVEPQTAVTVTSSHFDADYSRIIDVKISG